MSVIPVKDLGYSHLAPSFPQANAGGGGMGQDMSSNGLFGISLEPVTHGVNTISSVISSVLISESDPTVVL